MDAPVWTHVAESLEKRRKYNERSTANAFRFASLDFQDAETQWRSRVRRSYEAIVHSPGSINSPAATPSTATMTAVPDLNKPLPEIRDIVESERSGSTAEQDEHHIVLLSPQRQLLHHYAQPSHVSRVSSIYDFKAYPDGHISVHKAKMREKSAQDVSRF